MMMKTVTGLCAVVLAVAAVTPASAQYYERGRGYERQYDRGYDRGYERQYDRGPRERGGYGCVLHEHFDFGGAQLSLRDGASARLFPGFWNDRASSISCAPGCSITVWEHDFRGARESYAGRVGRLGYMNDRISSARVSCR